MDKVSLLRRWLAFSSWLRNTNFQAWQLCPLGVSRFVAAAFLITSWRYRQCSASCSALCVFACARPSSESRRADALRWWGTAVFLAEPPGLLSDWFLFTRLQIRKHEQLADVPGMCSCAQLDCRGLGKAAVRMPLGYWSSGPAAGKLPLPPCKGSVG